MAPTPIPTPLPAWDTALLAVEPYPITANRGLLDHYGTMGTIGQNEWRRVTLRFSYAGSTDSADDAYCSFDFVKILNGIVNNDWVDADYTAAELQLFAITQAWAQLASAQYSADLFRWYRRAYNPYGTMVGEPPRLQVFAPSGPPVRVSPTLEAGAQPNPVATQTSLSVTERTAFPHNWGRFYLPGLSSAVLNTSGHVDSITVDTLGLAIRGAFTSTMASGIFPVVPTTRVGAKAPSDRTGDAYGLLTLDHIQIDDVPDVIRRRRLKSPIHRYLSA